MRPSVSFSYESVLHNYFVRHNSLIFIFVHFFIAAVKYDGHESFSRFLRNKAVSHTFIRSFFAVLLAPVVESRISLFPRDPVGDDLARQPVD